MSSPSFYSAAGNFIDTVQGGVDPRTGLFNISLPLMNLLSGDLAGPGLPLGLSYSPLSQKDEGFGTGFTFNLTRYDIPSRRLVLSTGEEYSISPSGGVVYQKKLKSFIFNKTDEDSYQIIYKSGLIEQLIKYNSVFVTTLVTAPCGRYLSFDWDASARLVRVRNDDSTVLCQITYASESVLSTTLSVLPNDPSAHYDILFKYADGYINSVILPIDNTPLTWDFGYETCSTETNNQRVITRVSYPTGAREQVLYDFSGMSFPDAVKLAAIPRVTQHTFFPGGEQPPVLTKWEWTKENYLGKNSDRTRWVWDKDPLLEHLSATYRYGSTEKIIASDGINVLRSITRRYNSYHLLISERTLRNGKLYQRIMDYHAQSDVSFDEQPAQYLLPVSLKELWDDGTGKPVRSFFTYWKYDAEGNLLREERPDGSITECVYYPAGGEKGCPPDPHGFTRYLKNMTVTPRRLKGDESATVSVHTWRSLGTGNHSYVVPSRVVETTGNMQIDVNRIYNNYRQDRLTFGREHKRITTLTPDIKAGTSFVRRQSFSYETRGGRLLQSETLRTHDGLEATFSTLRHSSLGYLLTKTDAQGITVNHTYDRLGRVLTRAEAVGTNYERLTHWLYAIEGSGPVSLVTDSAGNQTKTFFDGAWREIRKQRLNKDTQKWFEVSLLRYNSQGEMVSNLSSDWVTEHLERCSISTSISYDGWGNVSEQAFSDDIKNQIIIDPIELTQILCTKGETSDQTFSSGTCTIVLDDKSCLPLTETRKNTEGIIQGIRHHEWDGRGFLRQETDEKEKKSTWTYDALGRVLTQTLPDGTVISRTYAPHLTENHVTSISVTGKDRTGSTQSWQLGTQEFDGLGRLIKRVCGGRTTFCTYEGASAVPSTVTLPSGKLLNYKYIPELGNVISSLTTDGVTQTFSYDTATCQMVKATAGISEIENILYPSGSVKAEAFTLNGETKKTAYIRMLKGDVIQYTDISGKETRCERDEFGRILFINDDALSACLEYDTLGLLSRQIVTDRVTKSSLTTDLEYDDFGQEITRTITDSNGESLKVTQTWRQDGLLAGRITQRDGLEIRKEQYGYDLRNRLRLYRVNGSSFPEDWRGHEITTQLFEYDALSNLINVSTCLTDASLEVAVYRYENSDDPTQLTSVERYEGKQSQTISLEYDTNGCMLKDGAGHTFNYDALGRLISVNGYNDSCSYVYDALNRLVSQNINNYPYHFYYRDGQLVSKVQTQWNAVTRLIRNGASCMGMSRGSFRTLMATDQNESVLWSHETSVKEGVLHIWAPYGSGKVTSEQPGFNGERVDPVSGVYHLGNGYRAYNPVLMRFNCPDNLSPFGAGGINPYAYCAGDPVNFTDPTGHLSWWAIAGIVLGGVGLIATAVVAGVAIAAAGGVGAAISAASNTSLAVGGLGVVADVTAIASGATEESNPEVSSALGWVSVATGLPALGYGVFRGAKAISGWWKTARSMPGLARGGAVSAPVARTGRTMASNSMHLGDHFNLFRAAGMRASRLIISAHGEQSLIPLRTFLPANTRLRFYASDGYSLLTRLHNVAKQSVVARETISGGGLVRNYNLSRVSERYSEVQSLVRQYGVDIVTVNNTASSAFYPADMNMLLRSLQSSNVSYDTIDAVICRGNWLGLNVPVQNALPA